MNEVTPHISEVLAAVPYSMALLPGFGVRMLAVGELIHPGDFELESCSDEQSQTAIYFDANKVGKPVPGAKYAEHTYHWHYEQYYRHTQVVTIGNATYFRDADVSAVIARVEYAVAKIKAREAELAAEERKNFGEAVARYRGAMDAGADEATLKALARSCDTLLNDMKFGAAGGIWWSTKTGMWGLGVLEEDDIEAMDHGATICGPHS